MPLKPTLFAFAGLLSITLGATAARAAEIDTALDETQIEKRFGSLINDDNESDPVETPTDIRPDSKSVRLAGVAIRGLSLFDPIEFLPLYEQQLGHPIDIEALRTVAEQITAHYHQGGYTAARAILPAQKIRNGIAFVDVIEGVINRVRVTGEVHGDRRYLESFLNTLTLDQPIDSDALETARLLLNDLPGIAAYTRIQRIAGSADKFELVVDVRQTHWSGDLEFDNRGSKILGENQGLATLSSFSALGLFESIKLKILETINDNELGYYALNTSWPLGARGLRLNVDSSYTEAEPGAFLSPLNIEVRNTSNSAGLAYPLLRTSRQSLYLDGKLNHYRSKAEVAGSQLTYDEIYSLILGLDYVLLDPGNTYSRYSMDITQGLSGLNRTLLNTADGEVSVGHEKFTVLELAASHRKTLTAKWSLLLKINGQYASRSLPPSQRFAFGGKSMGGAYDPAELIGDHGVAGRAELKYQLEQTFLPGTKAWVYSYYDIGRLWNIATHENDSAASGGLGITASAKHISGSLEIAQPFTRSVFQEGEHGDRSRIFASIKFRF